ncbi:MAG: NTP transferase domain-containing protein [Chloroflexi bacterium]|nr:NTP transferase domain-containing protein [Chloroflexota bacterium]
MSRVAAVILAGGKGERMEMLCHVRPKPVLPFAGKFKVIDFSLSNCIYSKINDIAVLADYERSQMTDYLRQWHLMNANSTNFHVLEPRAGSYSGTADAVYQNLDYLDKGKIDAVVVLAGDHVYKLDYRKMLAFHQEVNADVTVGVVPVPIEQAYRFGMVTIDADGRILDFLEKSPVAQSNLASMGIYVFNRKFLAECLTEDAADMASRHDFGYSILPRMVRQDRVFAYQFDGYWQDIGTMEAYYQANMELTKEQPCLSLNGSSPILTQEQGLSLPCIGKGAIIKNSLVSPGCVIKGRVENSVLSPEVWVDEQAVVRNSVIMGKTFIGRYSVVDHSVVDEGVKIGEYGYIGFGSDLNWDHSNITVLGKGVTVPPRTAVGRNCRILPHVGISDFVASVISHGEVVSGA